MTGDSPGDASFVGGGPALHRSTTPGEAGRPVAGLPAGGRGTGHAELVGRKGQCALEMPAVGRHPLWTAAHDDARVTFATSTGTSHSHFLVCSGIFIPSALP